MPFHYAIQLLPCNQGNDYLAPKLISLDVELESLRQTNPTAYFECFLALFNASTFSYTTLGLVVEDLATLFDEDKTQSSEFIKPSPLTNLLFLENLDSPFTLTAFDDPHHFAMNEPVRVLDQDFEVAKKYVDSVHTPTAYKIKEEINAIVLKHSVLATANQ